MTSLADALMADLGAASYRRDIVGAADIPSILEALQPLTMAEEIGPEAADTIAFAGNAALLEVGASESFSLVSPRVVSYLDKLAGQNIASITRTTRRQLARELAEGVSRGEGVRVLGRRVRDTLSLPRIKGRARTIARTETHNAANLGRLEGYKQSGVVKVKRWHATLDGRVRDTHRKLHKKTKPLNGVFKIRGASAQAPGQFGVAKEDINCRCVILPVIEKVDDNRISAVFLVDAPTSVDDFFKLQRRQLPDMEAAVLRGFAAWERAAIRALNRANG